jgi:ATP-dependent RNA helicase RhlE
MTFAELGLAQPILRAVLAEGYEIPTPIQAQSIPHLMEGRDLLGSAQTGTGKTAAFALPILHRLTHAGNPAAGSGRRTRVLILAPTRELAAQIGDSLKVYGSGTTLRQAVIFGGVGQTPQVRALQRGVDILIATPGRLVDLMNQGYVDLTSVKTFVLDEADRMLDMGFMPDLRRVIAKLPTDRQTPAIEQLAHSILVNPVRVEIAPVKANTDLIEQSVCFVSKSQKSRLLVQFLKTKEVSRAIVFARTKRGADRIAQDLNRAGIASEAMHGNKSQSARQRTLASFKSNRPPVLVATDLAARGIDVDGVTHVFNFDLPHEPETYVHRIGRTGRAGAAGIAIAFCDSEERADLKAIERLLRRSIPVDPNHSASMATPPAPGGMPTSVGDRPPAAANGDRRHTPRRYPDRNASSQGGGGKPATGGYRGEQQKRRPARNAPRP